MNLRIDLDNIDRGIRDLTKVQLAMQRGYKLGIDELATRTREKLIENLQKYGLGGSSLVGDIYTLALGNGLEIGIGTAYAVYVEYGTGIVGEGSPHPSPQIAWAYDINDHGDDGWIYKSNDGTYRWTKGQPSRPFMYDTWLWASRSAHQIIQKNINREVRSMLGRG